MNDEVRPTDASASTVPEGESATARAQVDPGVVAPLRRGETIGRYLVVAKLGEGGMGVVYAAYDPDLDRRVAVKLMRLPDPAGAEGRLTREARSMARLSHRNVVAVYDVGTVRERVFLAMELVEGITLKQWMRERPHLWEHTLALFGEAGRGLAAAHAAGLVHRDFKPANVLVGRDGRVLVGDFGLARLQDHAAAAEASPGTSGTPAYMAPEQSQGKPIDARADQFSFCVALYEGLYGERPFQGDRQQVMEAMLAGKVQPPPAGKAVPGWVRAAVLKGLHPDPAQRHASMDRLLEVLASDPGRARRKAGLAAGLLGIAAIGGLVALRAQRAEHLRCPAEAQRQVATWSADREQQARGAFAASGSTMADEAWERVSARLGGYSQEWATQWTAACEQEQRAPGPSSQLQRDCLVGRLQELTALTELFVRADRQIVDHATRAVSELTPLDRCRAALPLNAAPSPGAQSPLRAELVRGRVLEGAGKAQEAEAVFSQVLGASKARGYESIRAEALEAEANLEFYYLPAARPLAEVVHLAQESARLAESVRQDELAARARLSVLHLLTEGPPPYDAADEAGSEALAAVKRLGSPPDLEAQLDKLLGGLAQYEGRFEDASRLMRSCIELMEAAGRSEDLALASPLDYLGDLLRDEGRYDEALVHLRRALRLQERVLGERHPDLSLTLDYLGQVLSNEGRWAEAFASLERARRLNEATPNSADLAGLLTDESLVLRNQGHLGEARARCQRALGLDGVESLQLATTQGELGLVELADHHPELALPLLEQGLAVRGQKQGDRTDVAELRFGLAQALLLTRGDSVRAIALAQGARAAYSHAGAADRAALQAVERWLSEAAKSPHP